VALLKAPLGNGEKIKRENKFQVSPQRFVFIENMETRYKIKSFYMYL